MAAAFRQPLKRDERPIFPGWGRVLARGASASDR